MAKTVKMKYDLTEGGILNKLLLVAVPIMGTQLVQMTYNLTDMFWLGRLSSDAVASTGTAGMYLWLSMAFMFIGRMGAEIGVSQSLGQGDEKKAKEYSQTAFIMAAALGIAYMLAMIAFGGPLVGFFQIREANVAADAVRYLRLTALGVPATFISGALSGTYNGSGNSRTPFLINAVGVTFNVVFDPVFIFVFGMGIDGAAVATVIAQIIVCVLTLAAIKKDKNRPFEKYSFVTKPKQKNISQILKWSVPIGMESMFFTLLTMMTSRFVSAFGASAITVSRVGSQIESLSWLIGGGFGSALTSFSGQNYGARKWARIRQCFKISSAVMLFWGLAVTTLMYFAAGPLFGIFIKEPEIIEKGIDYLRILAMCQVMMCLEAVASGFFKGTGKTVEPSVVSITSNALRVPVAYFLSKTSLGLNGIWIGVTAGSILRGVWSYLWYAATVRKYPKADE